MPCNEDVGVWRYIGLGKVVYKLGYLGCSRNIIDNKRDYDIDVS